MREKRVNGARIKALENGWVVSYDTFEHMGEGYEDRRIGRLEKAFTYDFKDEEKKCWEKVVKFLTDWFYAHPGQTEY